MDFKNLLPAQNRNELRQWLLENHNKENAGIMYGEWNDNGRLLTD